MVPVVGHTALSGDFRVCSLPQVLELGTGEMTAYNDALQREHG